MEQKDAGDRSLHPSFFPYFPDVVHEGTLRVRQGHAERKALWNHAAFIEALRGITEDGLEDRRSGKRYTANTFILKCTRCLWPVSEDREANTSGNLGVRCQAGIKRGGGGWRCASSPAALWRLAPCGCLSTLSGINRKATQR